MISSAIPSLTPLVLAKSKDQTTATVGASKLRMFHHSHQGVASELVRLERESTCVSETFAIGVGTVVRVFGLGRILTVSEMGPTVAMRIALSSAFGPSRIAVRFFVRFPRCMASWNLGTHISYHYISTTDDTMARCLGIRLCAKSPMHDLVGLD